MLPESGIFMYRCDEVQNVYSNLHIFIDMHSWVPAEIFVGGGGGASTKRSPHREKVAKRPPIKRKGAKKPLI